MEVKISIDGDAAWKDLQDKSKYIVGGKLTHLATLAGGMQSGRPSVGIRIETEDGKTVFCELSLRLFQAANAAFLGRHGHIE